MDNGTRKVTTTNQKPSEAQLNLFNKYAHDGMSNEAISLITGYSKKTVDKYIKEEPIALNNWNNIKVYAAQQFSSASKEIQSKHNVDIEKQINALKQRLSELEAMKQPVTVPSFNWTVKRVAPRMTAKTNVNCGNKNLFEKSSKYQMNFSARKEIINLFSDHRWHTSNEVKTILLAHGYAKKAGGYTTTLRTMVPDIVIKRNRYILPA
jgi:transposase